MTIRDKYFGWKDIFFDRFVHCCNEKSDQPQGSNIPLAKINFDNKTGYVEDGTINIAELLQYLWINNKVYGCEYAPIDISSVLQTLIRLTENAKFIFDDQPGIHDMILYRGFFLRDDFLPGKDYSLDLDKIVSGMGGWYGEDEDPCYSMFVSQDQIWNLNPILKVLADEGSILAKELGYDMNSYVSDNGYTIYNPYLSWINHYYHYCPTFNEDKLKPWDRVEDRKNKFKMTDKVKRGANNWYYSGGTISCVDNFLGKEYRKNLRTFIYRGIVFFLDRIWHTPLFEKMGVKMKYNAYYCYAATSGIWYDKGFKERLAKRFNKSLGGDGELFGANLACMVCDRKDIDWEALRLWLDKYDDPTDKGMVNSPIQFMYLYLYYSFNK